MNLKKRMKEKKLVFGTWCLIPSAEVINVIAKSGLDYVIIDMEHGSMDFALVQRMVMAAEAEGCEAIVRVGSNDELEILRALDTGASGVIVPHIECVSDCRKAISYAKYPPIGIRGFSPYARAGGYTSQKGYTVLANEKILVGIIIESEEGIKNISEIIDQPDLDIVYVGTYDISSSLGVPGDVTNIKVLQILEECVDKIRKAGKVAGCLFHSSDELAYFKKIGIGFMVYKVDSSVLFDGFSKVREEKGEVN